jgi:hypothetical protein
MRKLSSKLTYANVMSSLAVFLVLSGATAFAAAKIGDKSIGLRQMDLTQVSNNVNVLPGEQKSVTAVCPAGTIPLTGGGGFPGAPATDVSFIASEAANGGWYTEGRSLTSSHTLIAVAWCLRNP